MVGPGTGGWTAPSETEQKSFKCPPCCPWRTNPTLRERSVRKKQSERERPRSGPSPGCVGDALNSSDNNPTVRIENNRTESSMKALLGTAVNIGRSDRFMLHLDLWKMSKLSFRARALDASKPLPVFRCEDLPDLHEYASINRAVPQMPTGMEKEEESVCFNGLDLWKYAAWLYFFFILF